MSEFYIKDSNDNYIPVNLGSIIGPDMNKNLLVMRVGSDKCPASMKDLELTEESFRQAEILHDLDVSIILTPYQIDVGMVEDKKELDDKCLYLQIKRGDNISELEERVKETYRSLAATNNVVVLPSPMTFGEYKRMKDILMRCDIRKNRRSRAKG